MKVTLKKFLTEMLNKYEFDVADGYTPVTRTYTDSNGDQFESTSLVYTTNSTHMVFDEETGEQVEKPVFVAISLSKNTKEKMGDTPFDSEFLFQNLNSMVDVDPEYPTSAKITSSNKVVDKSANKLANALKKA